MQYEFCVLIPCYNNFKGLVESMQSINYSREKYIVIIVDDGSTDFITHENLYAEFKIPPNFKIITMLKNSGIIKALNLGLEFIYANCTVEFIARLDCGDICSPERFISQILYFRKHNDVHLLGSWCSFKNKKTGEQYKYTTSTKTDAIMWNMNFGNVFIHPTVMWRVNGLDGIKYPEHFFCAEDYALFYNMILKVKATVIGEYLVTCEINQYGLSIKNRSDQLKSRLNVIKFYSKNNLLYFLGFCKLSILMILPYKIILKTKMILYKAA